jgi:thioredoxin reductase
VTVCGGGNAAHVAAGMFSKQGADVNLYFSFEEEAQRFREVTKKHH